MLGYDEMRLKVSLESCLEILIDTRLVPSRPAMVQIKSYYAFSGIWDWGDGTQSVPTYHGGIDHTYQEDGIYLIKNWNYDGFSRFQTAGSADAAKFLEIDYKNLALDGYQAFSTAINLRKVTVRKMLRQNIMLSNVFSNAKSFNHDVSDWVYWLRSDANMSLWFSNKNYTDYDYQWIDNIINACYDREINGDGWDGLVKSLGLGNCRRSTASDVAFNYLKFVRGWTITLNATVIT